MVAFTVKVSGAPGRGNRGRGLGIRYSSGLVAGLGRCVGIGTLDQEGPVEEGVTGGSDQRETRGGSRDRRRISGLDNGSVSLAHKGFICKLFTYPIPTM